MDQSRFNKFGTKPMKALAMSEDSSIISMLVNTVGCMTANQAGYYALKKCREQRWPHSDYDCCLANLEMDM